MVSFSRAVVPFSPNKHLFEAEVFPFRFCAKSEQLAEPNARQEVLAFESGKCSDCDRACALPNVK